MKHTALLVLLPALALAGSGPPDLGRRIVHRVAFECRLFEVRPGKAAEVPDGLPFSAKSRAGFKQGTIAADDLRTFFDGSFETLEGVTLAWSGAFSATQISPARATVPLPGPAAPDRTLELVLSASYLSFFDAGGPSARFGVGFAFRTAGTEDGAPAAVPPSVRDWVPSGAGFGAVLRESSGPDDPELLLVIGNWRHDGHVIVPARAAALPAADEPHAESASDPATNAPAETPAQADVDAAVLAKLDRIIVPEFEFKNADICDVVSRLGDCSREFDDETAASKRGVGFVLDLGGDASTFEEGEGLFAESPSSGVPPLTIKAKDWSLRALLDLVVEMSDLKYRIEGGHVAIRRKDDMRGETFERWRFTILPDIGGRYDLIGEWMDFFGQLGVSWPPGTYAERSGDDGLVVRNTPENLNLIRMIFGALSVNVLRGDPVVLEDAPAANAPAATNARADDDGWPPLPAAVESLLEEFRATGKCGSLSEAIWECKLAPVDSTAAALSNRIALVRRLVPFYDPDYDRKNPGPFYMHTTPPKGYRTGTPPSAVSDPVERAAYEERIRVHHEQANARNVQYTLRGFFRSTASLIEIIKPEDREELLRQLPEGFLPATRSPEAQGPHAENAEPQPHAKPAEIEPRAEAAEEKQ